MVGRGAGARRKEVRIVVSVGAIAYALEGWTRFERKVWRNWRS